MRIELQACAIFCWGPAAVGQDKAGSKEAVVVGSGCGCSGGDGCDDRWKKGMHVLQIYSSLSPSLLFPFLSTACLFSNSSWARISKR